MKSLVLLTVAVGVLAVSNCNNPLFAVANWPSDLQRPRYLTTPVAVTNSTFCSKFQSGSTSTCCDKDTIQDIVSLFQSRRDKMKTKGENLQGGVCDTFNDFDPDNQRAKGAGRELFVEDVGVDTPIQGGGRELGAGQGAGKAGNSAPPNSGMGGQSPQQGGKNSTASGQMPPPRNSTDAPRNSTDAPRNSTDAPRNSTDAPRNSTDAPRNSTEPSRNATEPPRNSTEPPRNSTEPPRNSTGSPRNSTEPPRNSTEPPRNSTDAHMNSTHHRQLPFEGASNSAATSTTVNGQGTNSSTLGPPPKENNPPGFNNLDVPESNLTSATPTKGRGKEKKRGWILKLSTAGQQAIANITRNMNALMKQFAHTMGKCMAAQLKHLAGMMCLGCDPDWESWVTGGNSTTIVVNLATDACTELSDACLDFVQQAQNLPALIEEMKASIQAVITAEISAGTIKASDVSTDDLGGLTKPSTSVTAVCTTTETCKTYICEKMSKGTSGVSPDPSTVADPASVSSSSSGRELAAATVTYQYVSSGYNSVSLGSTATSSSTTTSTTTVSIDGVSSTTAPLDTTTSTAAVVAVAVYLLGL